MESSTAPNSAQKIAPFNLQSDIFLSLSEIFGVKVSALFGVQGYFLFWEILSLIAST
jgi:hypothetical protein